MTDTAPVPTPPTLHIGLLLFPKITQLDLTGPLQVLARVPGAKVHILWKRIEPVMSDAGLALLPNMTLDACPPLDVICVPGGGGQVDLMDDAEVIAFVRRQGLQARYVTSVCTGALVLGAAGLLYGFKATTHWASHDQLALFGAVPVKERVVVDGNRITGGGVTAGIDFGLVLAEKLSSRKTAEMIQLSLEYNPQPPFTAGSPETASPEVIGAVTASMGAMLTARDAASARAAERLKVLLDVE
jgi:cyclohexyl-isocyanide hydratase